MNATPCNPARVAYNGPRSLETSLKAEPRPDSCGFFAPVPQASCAPVSFQPDGVRENTQYPEPSFSGFEPPSGAYLPGELFTPNMKELDMANQPADRENAVPPPVKLRPTTPVYCDREAFINSVYAAQVDLQLLATWLKSEPEPQLLYGLLQGIHYMRGLMTIAMPTLRRH